MELYIEWKKCKNKGETAKALLDVYENVLIFSGRTSWLEQNTFKSIMLLYILLKSGISLCYLPIYGLDIECE